MFKLYKKQKEKADIILKGLKSRDFILLTGEVGVGKTYMGTYIAKRWQEINTNDVILIISPKHVVSKWKNVLSLAQADMSRVILTDKVLKDNIDRADLIIYDEVHTIKTKIKHFSEHIETDGKFIGLTGSIVDKDVNDITNITNFFSNDGLKFSRYSDVRRFYESKEQYIRFYIEPLFTVGLSKDDVREIQTDSDTIIINTEELSIKMDGEESAFYNFVSQRLSSKKIAKHGQLEILNNFLDRVPNTSEFVRKTKWEETGQYNSDGKPIKEAFTLSYFIGELLHNKSTKKDKILDELIEKYKSETIIYTLNDAVAERIGKNTKAIYIDTRKPNAVENINEIIKTKTVVININHILTGVDLHANNIIWYQTPLTLTQEIQGVGRILRLSSSLDDKTVIYLYHENTMQEEIVEKLRENHILNNEMINKKESTISTTVPFLTIEGK